MTLPRPVAPPEADPAPAHGLSGADTVVAVGSEVLRIEAQGLAALAASLEAGSGAAAFQEAVARLAVATGRVVVSGIGKSGLVGRKIAATFASTGTPSLFVHPAEASHGDLGMIVAGDIVLVLSNSGEAAELADLVAHTRRFGLTLLAITARPTSTLARAADVVLCLPPTREACPMGLAPTTSTTLQMALGDALAVALLTRRGFTASDFRAFHPGGRLGAQLTRIETLMHTGDAVPLGAPDMKMDAALIEMTAKRFGCLAVVDARRRLLGVLTDGDLRRAMGPDLLTRDVGSVMNRAPRRIGPETLAAAALREMNDPARPVTCLFVTAPDATVLGIVHVHDLLRAGIA